MKKIKIHFLNTIWSDAIILENNNHFAFMDTGSRFYYPMIIKHLEEHNIKTIDFILLSHFHNDHYGNVKKIIEDYSVKKLYLKHYHGLDGTTSSGYQSNEEYIENEFKEYNDILKAAKENNTDLVYLDELNIDTHIIDFNGIEIELYDINNRLYEMYSDKESPFYMQKRFNENFNCLGAFIKVNNNTIYLGADVTCSKTDIVPLKDLSIKMLEKFYKKHNVSKINLYKSCHHGGGGTNTENLCNLLKADYTVITNTDRWLDTYDTYDNLRKANENVIILKTDRQKYIFEISDEITYQVIEEESLFLTLNKD